jgi:demethylmenaquinone methyltransferase/2-methoxy-6-polyprenyl-1,4-benzoquinol methylase
MARDPHHQSPAPEEPYEKALERLNRFQEPEARAAIADLGLGPGSRGLDVGCGVGLYALWLAQAVAPGGRVLGIERPVERVEAARRLVGARAPGRLDFRQGDATAIDAAAGTFDWVWCGDVLHHVQETGAALKEFVRVARPGGRIIVKESQVMPAVFLPGHPELERRIQAAEVERHREEAGGRSFLERRQRTLASMREAGLADVGLRTYLVQRRAPLDPAAREYIERVVFGRNWGPRLSELLSPEDRRRRSALCDPASSEFVLARPDYYCLYSFCVFSATTPA